MLTESGIEILMEAILIEQGFFGLLILQNTTSVTSLQCYIKYFPYWPVN